MTEEEEIAAEADALWRGLNGIDLSDREHAEMFFYQHLGGRTFDQPPDMKDYTIDILAERFRYLKARGDEKP